MTTVLPDCAASAFQQLGSALTLYVARTRSCEFMCLAGIPLMAVAWTLASQPKEVAGEHGRTALEWVLTTSTLLDEWD